MALRGGHESITRFAAMEIPPGSLLLAAGEHGLAHIAISKQTPRAALEQASKRLPAARHDPHLLPELRRQLHAYFAGRQVTFAGPVDLSTATPFQQEVLRACARIPYGRTITYGQLAAKVGRPGAARAVGATMAANPVPIVIPCHRVVAADGALGGFSAEQGVALKRWLLDLEQGGAASKGRQTGRRACVAIS